MSDAVQSFPGKGMPTPTNSAVFQSEDYELYSASAKNTLDITVKSILNLTVSSANRTTAINDLVACVNDLNTMDTEVWQVINAAANVIFPTYTEASVLSRGPFLSCGTGTATLYTRRTELLTSLVPALTAIKDAYTAQTQYPLIVSEDPTSTNTVFTSTAGYRTAYNDFLTKIAAAIALIPGLTTH